MRKAPSEYELSRSTVTIVVVLVIIAVGAFAYYCYRLVERERVVPQSAPVATITTPEPQPSVATEPTTPAPRASAQYRCDGRTRCSQMTSCDEAKFFLRNCPGTQMDGDNDGIPCEQQWCGN